MIHTARLGVDYIVEADVITESESYLNEHGYKTDAVAYHTVVNQKEDENTGYLVKVVETTEKPFEESDVVEDTIEVAICSCASYRFASGIADLSESKKLEWEPCKHIEALRDYRAERAESDESQQTL